MKALIIVDVQNDFMPTGSLPVSYGNEIIPFINKEMEKNYDLIVTTQDWHPENHKSFASNHQGKKVFESIDLQGVSQILWPNHCVQGSTGAEFHSELNCKPISAIFRKGMNPEVDSYSAFFDNNRKENTGLHGYLKDKNITELTFCGLAGDFCVAYSVNDALQLGYKVRLLHEGIKSIDQKKFEEYVKNWNF